jgi:SAM-dependent methyltransferase
MNDRIASHVVGPRVLEVGCGFGHLVENLRQRGLEAVGVDMLGECVTAGRARYPHADLRQSTSPALEFEDKSFDTLILKDTIHHIFGESDIGVFLREAKRVCRRRIVIFDPNPMPVLLMARRLIGHVDPVCAPRDAAQALSAAGFAVRYCGFSDVVAFPLSGGYVGCELVPVAMTRLGSALLRLDAGLERAVRVLRIERYLCWRYLMVGESD